MSQPGYLDVLFRDLMSVSMKPNHLLAMATLGVALGAVTGQALHAQTTVYYVAEVDVTDLDGYLKEYAPKAAASSKDFGGQTLAAGQEITQIEGAPPKRRVVIVKWNSLEQLQAWRNSERYKEDRKIGDKYAKTIRAFAVEGLPQN
jgi:uncharacterized protein (DUF1330 family)